MGLSFSKQTINDNLGVQNSLTQSSTGQCIGTGESITSDNTVIISNSNITGDITFQSQHSTNMSCYINNNLSSDINNIIQSMINQNNTTTSSIFPSVDSSSQSQNVNIQIRNNISQYLSSTCKASSSSYFTGNTFVLTNTNLTGGITLGAVGNTNANCTLANLASINLINNEQNNQGQSNTSLDSFTLIVIAVIIGIVVIIVVIILVIFLNQKKSSNTVVYTTPKTS